MIELTMAEMSQISDGWFAPGAPRDAIAANPALEALMPSVRVAHTGLRHAAPDTNGPARLKQLADEATGCDQRHDGGMRGSHVLLTGLAMLAPTEAERDQILALRTFVLPHGLEGTQKTYLGEAGEASLLAQRLVEEPARAAQLDAMVLPLAGGTPMRAFVEGWMNEAERLGEIEKERVALAGPAVTPAVSVVTLAEARAAREAWMRQVRALRAVASAIGITAEAHHAIFGELEAAEAKAAKRGRPPAVAKAVVVPA